MFLWRRMTAACELGSVVKSKFKLTQGLVAGLTCPTPIVCSVAHGDKSWRAASYQIFCFDTKGESVRRFRFDDDCLSNSGVSKVQTPSRLICKLFAPRRAFLKRRRQDGFLVC